MPLHGRALTTDKSIQLGIDDAKTQIPMPQKKYSYVLRAVVAASVAFAVSSSLSACGNASASESKKNDSANTMNMHSGTANQNKNGDIEQSVPNGYKRDGKIADGKATIYVPDNKANCDAEASEADNGSSDIPSTEINVEGSGLDDSIGESEIVVAN